MTHLRHRLIEMPQGTSLPPYRDVLSFLSKPGGHQAVNAASSYRSSVAQRRGHWRRALSRQRCQFRSGLVNPANAINVETTLREVGAAVRAIGLRGC